MEQKRPGPIWATATTPFGQQPRPHLGNSHNPIWATAAIHLGARKEVENFAKEE